MFGFSGFWFLFFLIVVVCGFFVLLGFHVILVLLVCVCFLDFGFCCVLFLIVVIGVLIYWVFMLFLLF